MRRILLFVLPILIIVSVAFTIFGIFQVRFEEEKLIDDIKRKAKSVAESMDFSVKHVLATADLKNANYLVEKFEARERLQGCVIYNKEGQILAITKRFTDWKDKEKPYLKEVLSNNEPRGELEKFKEYTVYSYILPILDEERQILGLVEVIHDTSYVFTRLTELWRRISITLISLLVLILFISIFLHRQIFVLPVQRLTDWFMHFQKGEIDDRHPIKEFCPPRRCTRLTTYEVDKVYTVDHLQGGQGFFLFIGGFDETERLDFYDSFLGYDFEFSNLLLFPDFQKRTLKTYGKKPVQRTRLDRFRLLPPP